MKTSLPYSKKTYKACIFDLDGTIVNTLPTVHFNCNNTLADLGLRPISEEKCRSLCRLPINEFYNGLLRLGGCPEDEIPRLAPVARDNDIARYLDDPTHASRPYEGMPELLRKLKVKGVVLGVLTNKPHEIALSLIDAMYPGLFDSVTGQTPDSISKPDPRSLLVFIAALGLNNAECLYVGDTDVDIRTAKAAGVDVAAAAWGFQPGEQLLEYGPEYMFEKPMELSQLF